MKEQDIAEIEKIIGYTFKNKKLLITAFTHTSYTNESGEENNEKLEFFGDSILNFVVAENLFFTRTTEGDMTLKRAALVSREPLKTALEKLDLIKFYRLGKGVSMQTLSAKFKSNLFEAIVAALYLDGGLRECKKFIFANLVFDDLSVDYKTGLQEILHSVKKTVSYQTEQTSVNPPVFMAKVFIDGKFVAMGEGRKKQDAEKEGAKCALQLEEIIKLKKTK